MTIQQDRAADLAAAVDRGRLVEAVTDIVNVPSATGDELDLAHHLVGVLADLGMDTTLQHVEPGRANAVGTLEGSGGGPVLMLNGHLDTSYRGDEPWLAGIPGFQPAAFERAGYLYGLGVANMKGALGAFVEALRALRDTGVRLRGDVLFAGVCGEIEKAPWGGSDDAFHRGYSTGARWLVTHGGVADYCLLGEPTEDKLVLAHFGVMWVRISTRGPFVHTAWAAARAEENSIARMADLMPRLREFVRHWGDDFAYRGVPAIGNIGAVNGGFPWRASRSPHRTDVFVDLRVPPGRPIIEARGRVQRFVADLRAEFPDAGIDFEVFVSTPGPIIDDESPLVRAVESAHRQVHGTEPVHEVAHWNSDAGALHAYGVPTLNYGAASGLPNAELGENLSIDSLVAAARVYTLTIADLCGVDS